MKREITGIILTVALVMITGCSQGGEKKVDSEVKQKKDASAVYEGTISGAISDSMCGKNHSTMGEAGKDPIVCTRKCVESGAKYVLVDSKSGEVYNLSDQEKFADLAGKTVSIEGHIDPSSKSIHVHSVNSQ